ncbi:hypothetical protein [Cryobacterium sp. SO1]|uniref:hypothetical protein n=1 Tax=Cryobacterium sp. SO1 TaxID=1897061 RepID=UPI0010236F20|nr:hypothetical protein [Cryobacterium sp. SO1]
MAKVVLSIAVLALVVTAGLLVTSFIAGVDTETGAQLSRTGSGLTVGMVVIVVLLSGWIVRLRRHQD